MRGVDHSFWAKPSEIYRLFSTSSTQALPSNMLRPFLLQGCMCLHCRSRPCSTTRPHLIGEETSVFFNSAKAHSFQFWCHPSHFPFFCWGLSESLSLLGKGHPWTRVGHVWTRTSFSIAVSFFFGKRTSLCGGKWMHRQKCVQKLRSGSTIIIPKTPDGLP